MHLYFYVVGKKLLIEFVICLTAKLLEFVLNSRTNSNKFQNFFLNWVNSKDYTPYIPMISQQLLRASGAYQQPSRVSIIVVDLVSYEHHLWEFHF